jgi:hypothetical protein
VLSGLVDVDDYQGEPDQLGESPEDGEQVAAQGHRTLPSA